MAGSTGIGVQTDACLENAVVFRGSDDYTEYFRGTRSLELEAKILLGLTRMQGIRLQMMMDDELLHAAPVHDYCYDSGWVPPSLSEVDEVLKATACQALSALIAAGNVADEIVPGGLGEDCENSLRPLLDRWGPHLADDENDCEESSSLRLCVQCRQLFSDMLCFPTCAVDLVETLTM